jgi:multidrug efflux pump subunit AcrB
LQSASNNIIDIDQDKANRAGVTNQDIALSLMTALSGFTAGDFRDGEDNIDIVMRSEGGQKLDVETLRGLNIFAQATGKNIPLMQVADLVPDWQYAKIIRRDLNRTLTVACDAKEGYTASDITKIIAPFIKDDLNKWPEGYSYELGGESESSKESMGAVGVQLPLAGLIILMLMIGQFNSMRKTFIILSTVPLGLIGVLSGLYIFQSFFGFMAFLGLIDCVDTEKNVNGKNDYDAVVTAALQRFRPIMLSTLTSAMGLIPMYTGGGLLWEPMAVAIMVGQICATAITLLYVPALYKLLYRAKKSAV